MYHICIFDFYILKFIFVASIYAWTHLQTCEALTIYQRMDDGGHPWVSSSYQVHTPTSWLSSPAWHSPPDPEHCEDCDVCTVAVAGSVDWHTWQQVLTSPRSGDMCQAGRNLFLFFWQCKMESLQVFCSSLRDVPSYHEFEIKYVPAKLWNEKIVKSPLW